MAKAQNMAQLAGRTLYHQGDLSYFEAINKEALKNAYSRCQEEGIILVTKGANPKSGPTVRLAPEWIPERDPESGELIASGRLWDFIEKIAMYRREGKNRRDGAAVSTRVFSLAARLNQQLFQDAEASLAPKAVSPKKKDKGDRDSNPPVSASDTKKGTSIIWQINAM